MNLAESQNRFARHLLYRNTDIDTLNVSGPFAAEQLLQLYRNNFYISLTEYLQACFPVTLALVGVEFFAQLSKAFIQRHPLEEASFGRYGRLFPEFVVDCEQTQSLPYLADVVQLEWSMEASKACTHRQFFPFESLARLTTGQQACLVFDLAEGVELISSHFPVFSIWQGATNGDLDQINMDNAEQAVIYPAQPGEAKVISLLAQPFQLLTAFRAGTALSDLELPGDFQAHLSAWISQGIVNNYHLIQSEKNP